jgi:hypothetical protein
MMNPAFALSFALQTTQSSTTTQNLSMVSVPVLLILGWAAGIILTILGATRHVPRMFSYGILVMGLMTILTPFSIYAEGPIVTGGTFAASASDFTIITLFSALGGAIMVVSRVWHLNKASKNMT